jgi:hypothetical protein
MCGYPQIGPIVTNEFIQVSLSRVDTVDVLHAF